MPGENHRHKLPTYMKEIILILATALGLFGLVSGLAFVLQPESAANSTPELSARAVEDSAIRALDGPAKAGAALFGQSCAACHGDDAKGDEGPSLYDLTRSDARITTIIKDGIKGEMPRFAAKFSDADIQSLIAFLRTLKN